MNCIDAHLHFWKYNPAEHAWISDEFAAIRRDFLPQQLEEVFRTHQIAAGVAVQADQTAEETDFLLQLSTQSDLIKGVVGWVDLQSPNLEERLEFYSQYPVLKGFRHILQGEKQRDFCLNKNFLNGISLLERYNFSYDILILPDQLQYIPEFVARFPNQRFILDHIAKPMIKRGEIAVWEREIRKVAAYEQVSCKVSGLVTEADLKTWKTSDFNPYLEVVTEAFGIKRLLYGSDWPVCLAAGNYTAIFQLLKTYFNTFSAAEQELFFYQNATDFYRL